MLTGKSGGGFNAKTDYTTGGTPVSVAIADVNGDGFNDIVTANRDGHSVSVLTNLAMGVIKTNNPNQTLTGAGEAGSTVKLYDNGSTTALATTTVAANGTWSAGVTLSGEGTHSIVAKDTDAAGNVGVSGAKVYTLDTVAPTVAITSTGSVTNVANQTITGTGEAGTTVKLYDNGSTIALATATVAANGTWSAEVTLSGQGTHSLVATDTDAAGNVGISSEVLYKLGVLSQVGKDTLTGGTGHDLFIYTAPNQSKVKAADVIQNFTHGEDDIDLSAIAGIGHVQGPLKAASIKVAAHSVAWTVDKSGDTQVYVNTTDNAEFQPQAQMKIVLTGHPTLDAGDFVLV